MFLLPSARTAVALAKLDGTSPPPSSHPRPPDWVRGCLPTPLPALSELNTRPYESLTLYGHAGSIRNALHLPSEHLAAPAHPPGSPASSPAHLPIRPTCHRLSSWPRAHFTLSSASPGASHPPLPHPAPPFRSHRGCRPRLRPRPPTRRASRRREKGRIRGSNDSDGAPIGKAVEAAAGTQAAAAYRRAAWQRQRARQSEPPRSRGGDQHDGAHSDGDGHGPVGGSHGGGRDGNGSAGARGTRVGDKGALIFGATSKKKKKSVDKQLELGHMPQVDATRFHYCNSPNWENTDIMKHEASITNNFGAAIFKVIPWCTGLRPTTP